VALPPKWRLRLEPPKTPASEEISKLSWIDTPFSE